MKTRVAKGRRGRGTQAFWYAPLLLLPLGLGAPAAAQSACSLSGTTCTFPAGSQSGLFDSQLAPLGTAAPNITYQIDSNPVSGSGFSDGMNRVYLVETFSAGGDGSGSTGPGQGGDLTLDFTQSDALFTLSNPGATTIDERGLLGVVVGVSEGGEADLSTSGQAGGDGGSLTVNNQNGADIQLIGDSLLGSPAAGLFLRSRGGTSGTSGVGGAGGDVTITNQGSVELGQESGPLATLFALDGVLGASLGGEGGPDQARGGDGGAVTITQGEVVALFVIGRVDQDAYGVRGTSVGGPGTSSSQSGVAGGAGGDGGEVTVTSGAQVAITDFSRGDNEQRLSGAALAAISQGGPGDIGQDDAAGGAGGDGGAVSITQAGGSSEVDGAGLVGLWAVSRGGMGGPGDPTKNNSNGGAGGAGGQASITLQESALVTTFSDEGTASFGLLAQSIGGLGGPGGDGGAVFGDPGSAGAGGDAGGVTISIAAGSRVLPTGDFSSAVAAQSIAGGGGTGGDFTGLFGSAGAGGTGGTAGLVTITNAGEAVTTSGDHAYGLLAQSIGGTGGSGGVTEGLISLGGVGGAGGGAEGVTITNSGAITTDGYGAFGILAQSITGGGGAAGAVGGLIAVGSSDATPDSAAAETPGTLTLANSASITTSGDAASAVLAQSIGASGGSGAGSDGVVSIGSAGAPGGDGGAVMITEIGSLTTDGAFAHGLSAQSIGGGGGNGGSSFSASILVGEVAPAIGGSAGGGGSGGAVTITNSDAASIATQGVASTALQAQSIGGGGGSGGDATSAALATPLSIAIGGTGGDGGSGGAVKITLDAAQITSDATRSLGILAQSLGGGGGAGGSASTYEAGVAFNVGLALGGRGGGGGDGEAVTVELSNSSIMTAQDPESTTPIDAYGLVAQSLGGGGGLGGAALADSLSVAFPPTGDVSIAVNGDFALGGTGGDGGSGGKVVVSFTDGSQLTTEGQGSHGIIAQSLGGGGGLGGDSSALAVSVPDGDDSLALNLAVALGGSGGNGGSGGEVELQVGAESGSTMTSVSTAGDFANAVMAQSIGGGGGSSGVGSSNTKSIGGVGSIDLTFDLGAASLSSSDQGASGGTVDVLTTSLSEVSTQGSGARGVLAQSIGGGGGAAQGGTLALSATSSGGDGEDESSNTATVTLGLGMKGGAGGDGGPVSFAGEGSISTTGGDADGVLLQSIGGGGGLAGSAGNDADAGGDSDSLAAQDDDDDGSYTFTLNIGGSGGEGGDGGTIEASQFGSVATVGDRADGLVAQSIGGGGGVGGSATASGTAETVQLDIAVGGSGGSGGTGGDITVNGGPGVSTEGFMAHGLLLQSIGGGGGQAGDGSDSASGTIALGGSGAAGGGVAGTGGMVTLLNGAADTSGDDAYGALVQSIGAGGGVGGAANSSTAGGTGDVAVTLSLGGSGGAAGDGGAVQVSGEVTFVTSGDRAFGLVAQSVGGGGGLAGAGDASNILGVGLGGSSGTTGDGGTVMVSLDRGVVQTSGSGAHGIIAQSVGGGGGIAGDISLAAQSQASADSATQASGSGGAVSVSLGSEGSSITVTGENAVGIIAQSVGSGGGLGLGAGSTADGGCGSDCGFGGPVSVAVTAGSTVSASGENGIGLFAQSDSASANGTNGESNGPIIITVDGEVSAGGGDSAAMVVSGGSANSLTVGSGGKLIADEGVAGSTSVIYRTTSATENGSLTIDNSGEIFGSVVGATISTASDVAERPVIGTITNRAGGQVVSGDFLDVDLVNAGLLTVGGKQTAVSGDFTQTESGQLLIDGDFEAGTADLVTVAGDVVLDGSVQVTSPTLLPDRPLTVITAGGSVDGALAVERGRLFNLEQQLDGQSVTISVTGADFTPEGPDYTGNQVAAAGHLQGIWNQGGGPYGSFFATLEDLASQSNGAYQSALEDLAPGVSNALVAQNGIVMNRRFDRLMSCPEFTGDTVILGESECLWLSFGGGGLSMGEKNGVTGYRITGIDISTGGEIELAEDWFLGLVASYERAWLTGSDGRVTGQSDTAFAGLAGKWKPDPKAMLSLAAGGSYSWVDNDRDIAIPGFSGTASSSPNFWSLGGRFHMEYQFDMGDYYLMPYQDIDLVYTVAPSYTESGAGSLDLEVDRASQVSLSSTKMFEIGSRMMVARGWTLRSYAAAGVTIANNQDFTSVARLAGAPDGSGDFSATIPIDKYYGRAELGFHLQSTSGFDLRLEYEGAVSGHSTNNVGSLRLGYRF
ncbi:MAG: autotransporter outer membrane beta-barrel domain-containing protein [Pseudomonadota bacterium]